MPTEPTALTSGKLFWHASFEDEDAFDTEHKERLNEELFETQLALTAADRSYPARNFEGSYTGPMWHVEKLEACPSISSETYTIVATAKARDGQSAREVSTPLPVRCSYSPIN